VVSLFDRKVLRGRQRESRSQYALDRGIIREVDEHGHMVEGSLFFEVVAEEA